MALGSLSPCLLLSAPRRPNLQQVRASLGTDVFVLDLAEKLEDNAGSSRNAALDALREASAQVAVNCSWPSSKDEEYRFTDVRFLTKQKIQPAKPRPQEKMAMQEQLPAAAEGDSIRIVFVDGVLCAEHSETSGLPQDVFVGSVHACPDEKLNNYALARLAAAQDSLSSSADLFTSLNGVGALDWGMVLIPKHFKLEKTIHVVYYTTSAAAAAAAAADDVVAMSNPRLLVVAEEGSEAKLIEEFIGADSGASWTNSVCEIVLAPGAALSHNYVQMLGRSSVNVKKTYVSQDESSGYKLVEVEVGARLSRHNLHVEQQGSDTTSELSTFLLCGRDQLQDLHSKLILNHPRGNAKQLQKSIVTSSSGHAVFDGNVRVNRYAQQTDAAQLSRCLLLAPRATVNVKPNLQIVADDVKCSHGAAISDLEDEQLFYFQARGISADAARSALVFSFGAEIVEKLEDNATRKRVEEAVRNALTAERVIVL